MKALVSVLIVEPSEIICQGLKSLLEEAGGFNVLASMHDSANLQERLPVVRPDVLIINPTLLSSTPRQQLAAINGSRPAMPVLALVYQYVEPELLDLFCGVVDIRVNRSSLVQTINSSVSEMSSKMSENESDDATENYELSERETEVLVLVAKGLSSKEIADKLHISIHTVNSHRKNITHKTGIKSVAGLAVYAMIHNLIEE